MASEPTEFWTGDGWPEFVLGVAHAAGRTTALFDEAAWNAAPCEDPPSSSKPDQAALVDALLGLDVLCRRLTELLDRCDSAPATVGPPTPAPVDLLR